MRSIRGPCAAMVIGGSKADWPKITTGLKQVYTAATVTAAEACFADGRILGRADAVCIALT